MNSRSKSVVAVILAAGKGVRMKSSLPKVLHPLLGKPMVSYVIQACRQGGIERVLVVVGFRSDLVRETLGPECEYVEQTEQLGTGHALMMAQERLKDFHGDILVLAGDTPFLTASILNKLIRHHQEEKAAATMMTAIIDPPPAYGRIVRDASGRVLRIVEERDASREEKKITEVNTSHYCFQAGEILPLLSSLKRDNDQGEYYLTDVIQLLVQKGSLVEALNADDPHVLIGVNSRGELNRACRILQNNIINRLSSGGVTIVDASSVMIEPDVKIGKDTMIYPFTFLSGETVIGQECVIGPQVKLLNAKISDHCRIEFSVIENRKIEAGAVIGPFASLSGEK
ncbi:NTP transferase domain-containing protein [bacterium]|nr:NTP transferase domain-containing protein [bacterium]